MPMMDGLETLETIRAAPEHRGLPVVMLTSEKNEALVRRLVALGITGFLAKPISRETMADGLARIIARLRQPVQPKAPASSGPVRRILVVEQDPDRRHFLMNTLAGHYDVVEADSAASALQMCLGPKPPVLDVVLVGPQVGLPPVEMFIPKLRAIPHLSAARIAGCAIPDTSRELFDIHIDSGHVPEVFLADLSRALSGVQTPLARILLVRPSLADDVARATEQLFGMMLSCEIDVLTSALTVESRGGVHATIGLKTDDGVALSLLFNADMASARAIAGRMIGVTPGDVEEVEVLACAAEVSNIVMGRLRNRLIEAGIQAQIQLPTTWAGDPSPGAGDDPHAIEIAFVSRTLDARFGFVLLAQAV
jgi:CheY-like chemotaxis protein/CheY-specific phosphatase CheX